MKALLCVCALVLAVISSAVLDLQQLTRYNPSAPVGSDLQRVIAKPGGGFYGFGYLGDDLLLSEFDGFGGLIRSQFWDSPESSSDSLIEVGRYPDGSLMVATYNTAGSTYLIKFSASLTVLWEVKLATNYRVAALDGTGSAYVFRTDGLAAVYNSNGAIVNAAQVNMRVHLAHGVPGASGAGVVVGGVDGSSVPRIQGFSQFLVPTYNQAIGSNGTVPYMTNLVVHSTGMVLATANLGAGSYAFVWRDGAGAVHSYPGVDVKGIQFRGTTQALLCAAATGGSRLLVMNLSDGSTPLILPTEGFTTSLFAELTGINSIVSVFGEERFASYSSLTGASTLYETLLGVHREATAISTSRAAFVGTQGGDAMVTLFGQERPSSTLYRFPGAPSRSILDSKVGTDGRFTMAVREHNWLGERILMLKYRTDGVLVYAKEISFNPNECPNGGSLALHPDGSTTFAGQRDRRLYFARVSGTGAVSSTRVYSNGSSLDQVRIEPLENGASAVMVAIGSSMQFNRIGSTGLIELQTTDEDWAAWSIDGVVRLASGNFVVASNYNGDVQIRVLNPVNGVNSSTIIGAGDDRIRIAKDPAGNLVLGRTGSGNLTLERRSAANISTVLNSRVISSSNVLVDLRVSPNGNTALYLEGTGADLLSWYQPGGFANGAVAAVASTVTIPHGIDVGADNVVYLLGGEVSGSVENVYVARYLANGVRSAQRRIAGQGRGVFAGSGVWVTGRVSIRRRGTGPFVARYSL